MTGKPSFAWPAGIATGIGSLPGSDPAEALRLVLGEIGELPYLPELPGRGLGADLLGRGCALLVDLPTEYLAHGWTLTSHPGRDLARARDELERDLDLLSEQAEGVPLLKVQVPGSLTLAAGVELPTLHKVLIDPGAVRDLTASLAEGVRRLLVELSRRLPGTAFVLQVDEPALPAVLTGRIATPSGYGTVRAMERSVAQPLLAELLGVAEPGARVLHCCAGTVPYELIRQAGADAVAVDASLVTDAQLDGLGAFLDDGGSVWLGVVPGTDSPVSLATVRETVRTLWNKLGFDSGMLADRVVLTPSCGLAGASMPYVRRVFSILRDAATAVAEQSL